jgi:hypothetical protein
VIVRVPTPGEKVIVSPSQKMSFAKVYADEFFKRSFTVDTGVVGDVISTTQSVTGEGRYIYVRFADNLIGYIHESNLNNA